MTQITDLGTFNNNLQIGTLNNSATYNSVKIRVNNPQTNIPEGLKKSDDDGIYNAVDIEVNDPSVNVIKDRTYDYPEADKIVTYEQTYIMPIDVPAISGEYPAAEIIEVPEPNFTTIEAEKTELPEEVAVADIADEIEESAEVASDALSFHGLNFKANPNVEIIPDANIQSKIDVNNVLENLTNEDYDIQALQMEEITKALVEDSKNAIPYITSDVFTNLSEIVNKDSSELEPPSEKQVEIRKQIMMNRMVAEKELADGKNPKDIELPFEISNEDMEVAMQLSPLEKAERNKTYGLLTLAALTKVYAEEFKNQTGNTVPLTDLPGVATMVDTLRDSKNSEVKATAIISLAYIYQPEYKNEIDAILNVAGKDKDPIVAQTAQLVLQNLQAV